MLDSEWWGQIPTRAESSSELSAPLGFDEYTDHTPSVGRRDGELTDCGHPYAEAKKMKSPRFHVLKDRHPVALLL